MLTVSAFQKYRAGRGRVLASTLFSVRAPSPDVRILSDNLVW
jgi:hypothetical protein